MAGATKLGPGAYSYREHRLICDLGLWRIFDEADTAQAVGEATSKKSAIVFIDKRIDLNVSKSRESKTDAELIAIDGVGWAWLEQRVHVHAPVEE